LLAVLLLVGGCGGESSPDKGSTAQPSEPETTQADTTCADTLALDEAEKLADEDMGEPHKVPVGGLEACRWDAPDSDTWVQAIRLPAAEWAEALPELIEQVRESGLATGDTLRKLEEGLDLLESGELGGDAACRLFTTMVVEIQGAPAGSREIVNYVPTEDDPRAVNAQACRDGVYVSVQLVAGDIEASADTTARVQTALRAVLDADGA
jgi:hypothetical protein